MEKYILQILEDNSRVIIPEFGAFIIKQKNPLDIVFNEFLQYNDGVLVDAIAKGEGTDRDSAKKKIDDFVKEINSQLDKGDPYIIEQLGLLVKSSTGKISLEKEKPEESKANETEKPAQSKGVSESKKDQEKVEKKLTPTRKTAPDQKKEVKEEADIVELKAENNNKKESQPLKSPSKEEKQDKKEIRESAAKESKASVHSGTTINKEKSEPQVEITNHSKKTAKTLSPETKDTNTKKTGYYTPRTAVPAKEPKKKKSLWLWVIIILVVNGIIITYFIMSDQLSGLFNKPEEIATPDYYDMTNDADQADQSENDIIEPTEVESTEQIIEEEPVVPKTEPLPVASGKRYYVVAGVFREEQNADNLVLELRNQGYNAEKFGKIGNLHAVSFGVYTSKSDAERELHRIKKEVNPEAWIKVKQ